MSTLQKLSTTCAIGALAVAISFGAPSAARAQSQQDFAQMMAAMKRLEARVAVLEGENKQAKREAEVARAEARALWQKTGTAAPAPAATANAASVPPGIYAMATKAPPLPPVPSWSGLYWGAAFGLGRMRGQTDSGEIDQFTENERIFGAFPSTSFFTQTTTSSSSLSGHNVGAIANLYLGYNFMAAPTVILGGQVEGGVSNIRVNMTGSGTALTNASSLSNGLPSGSSTTTENFLSSDTLDNRWMVSVLGRGGVLVDPQDFLYVIGGYTYGRFEAFGTSFGLNGATIGAGWERQVALGWTLRGEYRFTKFQNKDVTNNSASSSTEIVNPINETFSSTSSSGTTNRVSADMHSLWLGVAHYFNP